MNKRQANKVFKSYRVKGPRGKRGPGHRYDTLARTFSKKLSLLQRQHGIVDGIRVLAELDCNWLLPEEALGE